MSPASGTVTSAGTPVTIGYNPAASLAGGSWPATVTVNTPTGSPTTTTIPVTLVVSLQPLLNVPAATLSFSSELNSSNPPAQSVNITATSTAPQTYSVSAATTDGNPWLVAPTTGTTPGPLSISVNTTGLAPGAYSGTVSVLGAGAGNGPFQIPVTLKVSNDPSVVANFTAMALPYQIGQTAPVTQAITVSSSNGAPLNFVATPTATGCSGNWLALSGASGATTGQVTVAINGQGLGAGTCTGTVSIAATNPATGAAVLNSPLIVPVTLTVSNSALLVVSPLTPAVLTAQVGGNTQGPQTYTFTSSDSDVLSYTVVSTALNGAGNWLDVSATNGRTASGFNTLGISVQPGQLTAGTYAGTVTVTATGPGGAPVANSPLTIPVTFIVTAGSLVLNPAALTFQQAFGGTAPANQSVNITSTGLPLGFAVSAFNSGSVDWLTVSPGGATPGSISVGVNGFGLAQGSYSGTVAVVSTTPNAGNRLPWGRERRQ